MGIILVNYQRAIYLESSLEGTGKWLTDDRASQDWLRCTHLCSKVPFAFHYQGSWYFSMYLNHLESLLNQPQLSDSVCLGWARKFAFLTRSQVMLMLVRWSHFGNHCSNVRLIAQNHDPLFMCLVLLQTVNSWNRTVLFVFVLPGSNPLFVSQ